MNIEALLQSCWFYVLGVKSPHIKLDFFSAGGDDLLFEALINQIIKTFNLHSKKDDLYNCKNIYEQKKLLEELFNESNESIIVKLKDGSQNHAVIFVHPIGGTLFSFMKLVELINEDVSIYGIEDCLLHFDYRQYQSIEEQAAYYIRESLHLFETFDAVILAGYSSGGTIACEMTRQLTSTDITVKHLVMFDSWSVMPFGIEFRNNFKAIIKRQYDKIKPEYYFKSKQQLDYWHESIWNRMCLVLKYILKPSPVRASLFVPKEETPEYKVEHSAIDSWHSYFPSLQIKYVAGNHENLLEQVDISPIGNHFNALIKAKN